MTDLFTLAQGGFFMQDKRLLTLSFPHQDAPSAIDSYGRHRNVTLVAERLVAHEGLGIDFHVDLTLLANEAGSSSTTCSASCWS